MTGEEWTFAVLPTPQDLAAALEARTGWPFQVAPFERGEVTIVSSSGDGGIRWAAVAEDVARVDVHERITPYLSWQVDAALLAAGGTPDHPIEAPPLELAPWADVRWWNRIRYGARGWLVQVVLVVILAVPVLLIGLLFVAASGGGRTRRDEEDAP